MTFKDDPQWEICCDGIRFEWFTEMAVLGQVRSSEGSEAE
jgi:hypothetical protein